MNGFCKKIGKATLMGSINKRELLFIGHVARSHGIGNDILSGMVCGTRRRERPRRKLENDIKDIAGVSMAGLLQNAQNRDCWGSIIVVAAANSTEIYHRNGRNLTEIFSAKYFSTVMFCSELFCT